MLAPLMYNNLLSYFEAIIQNVQFFGRCMRCQCQFKVSSVDVCSCLHTRSDHVSKPH